MATIKPVPVTPPDPIYQLDDGSWWFYDETWTRVEGPFNCEFSARKWSYLYCKYLNDGPTI